MTTIPPEVIEAKLQKVLATIRKNVRSHQRRQKAFQSTSTINRNQYEH